MSLRVFECWPRLLVSTRMGLAWQLGQHLNCLKLLELVLRVPVTSKPFHLVTQVHLLFCSSMETLNSSFQLRN